MGTGAAGAGGVAAIGGAAGLGGAAGSAGCSFDIQDELSTVIPTVGIVHWSTDLAGLTSANVEFTLNDPAPDEINRGGGGPIDVSGQMHRALLLGMKAGRSYTYRIVAHGGGNATCTSADRSLTTGPFVDPNVTNGDSLVITVVRNSAPAPGFIVTSDYVHALAYVIDTDGDFVWWAASPYSCGRARMDWEGANMWMLEANGTNTGGDVRRISMDGTDVEDNVAGLAAAHHDLAVLPGGIVATLLWTTQTNQASDLVERAPDGTIETVARIDGSVFPGKTVTGTYHANSLAYHVADDTYTVGDLYGTGYAKLTRGGQVVWQFLASCAAGTKCATGDTEGNHGHHLLDSGTLLFFKARVDPSLVDEYSLTETSTSLSASLIWSYTPDNNLETTIMGDVQRLPNGDTLIVWADPGEMREVSPAGDVIQRIVASDKSGPSDGFGYADFRQSLYGPPLR